MKILVTGSSGQLGLGIKKYFSDYKNQIIFLSREGLDITAFEATARVVKEIKPDIIINCAADTRVDYLEKNRDTAFLVNAVGARNIAIAAQNIRARIVHISTDYVFDGSGILENSKIRPYNEFDIKGPKTVYGWSKHEGEKYIQQFSNKFYIIRTAWLYGEGKNFIKNIIEQSKYRRQITIVNDQYGSPTSVKEVVNMIAKLINTEAFGVYHGTASGECTWYEYAKEIITGLQIPVNIIGCSSEEYITAAKRPRYSVLDNMMLRISSIYSFKDWKEAFDEYMKEYLR